MLGRGGGLFVRGVESPLARRPLKNRVAYGVVLRDDADTLIVMIQGIRIVRVTKPWPPASSLRCGRTENPRKEEKSSPPEIVG